jgi:transposase
VDAGIAVEVFAKLLAARQQGVSAGKHFTETKSQRPDLRQPAIKQYRRVATRYDKLAANYLAFIKIASIRIWLRVNESTP